MTDDIAYNEQNTRKWEIIVRNGGENLYCDVSIDYKLTDMTAADLRNILLENHLDSFPDSDVLSTDGRSNVLRF